MADASAYLRAALYAHLTGGDPLAQPSGIFVALFTGTDESDEIAEAGYQRQEVTLDPDGGDPETASPGAGTNENELVFGPIESFGSATHFALYDAVTDGNRLTVIKPLVAPAPWSDLGNITFEIGSLTFTIA